MAWAKITLIGAMSYYENKEDKLFDFLNLPEGLDKEILIDDLVYRAGDFELLHINPEYTRYAIGAFSNKWAYTWEKWNNAINKEYEPLWNYDRHEESIDTHTGTQNKALSEVENTANTGTQSVGSTGTQTLTDTGTQVTNHAGSDSTTNTGTSEERHTGDQTTNATTSGNTIETPDKETTVTHENITNGQTTTTNSVYPYDDSGWHYKDKSIVDTNIGKTKDTTEESGTNTVVNSGSGVTSRTDDLTDTRTDDLLEIHSDNQQDIRTDDLTHLRTDDLNQTRTDALNEAKNHSANDLRTDDLKDTHELRAYGNIGVTTSQQMLQQELDIARWNIYQQIADMFIEEFCITVY